MNTILQISAVKKKWKGQNILIIYPLINHIYFRGGGEEIANSYWYFIVVDTPSIFCAKFIFCKTKRKQSNGRNFHQQQSPQSWLKTEVSMVHKINVSVGHGAKRKRSVDDQGQTTKRQKTGARWVLGLCNVTELYLSLKSSQVKFYVHIYT